MNDNSEQLKGDVERVIPAYLINLDESVERLASVTANLKRAGIEFSRVPAFDGRKVDIGTVVDCDPGKAFAKYGRTLTGGEYGCYKSHLACARRIIEDGHEYALVFEDDVSVDENILSVVRAILLLMEDKGLDWYLINLGAPSLKIYTRIERLSPYVNQLVAAHYFPQGAFAMLYSKKGAQEFVENHSHVVMTVDNLFRHIMVRKGGGYAVTPPIARHVGEVSVIDEGKFKYRYKNRAWNYGLLKQRRIWHNRLVAYYRKFNLYCFGR